MHRDRLLHLIDACQAGTATAAERQELDGWYAGFEGRPLLSEQLDAAELQRLEALLLQRIRAAVPVVRRPAIRRFYPYAAAVALFALALGAWWAVNHKQLTINFVATEILPGGNRATLTLADGRVIDLDEARTGIVVGTGTITYDDGSALDALSSEAEGRRDISLLELTTPKGGTYQVTLPDGSKVWLNSASTLKYPSRFTGDNREVFLEGEAFFEIQPQAGNARGSVGANDHSSFSVQTENQTVNVLGTQFNLSAYPDEPETKTTLVEGKVRVEAQGSSLQLVPGEQGVAGDGLTKSKVDVNDHIAWRDGLIVLKGASIPGVVRQIERWYDVEFVGASDLAITGALSGELPRDIPLSEILAALETHVHATFKISGRRVIVEQ